MNLKTSQELLHRIERSRFVGYFSKEDALSKELAFIEVRQERDESTCALYVLIDPSDGIIADVKFQCLGSAFLIGALEVTCSQILRKHVDRAKKVSPSSLIKELHCEGDLPYEWSSELNLILLTLEEMSEKGVELNLPRQTPLVSEERQEQGELPDWQSLSYKEKIDLIEEIVDKEIRPYIELDEGGIKIVELREDRELIIAYQGACTSCYSSVGSTLSAIQGILQTKVHPELVVIPETLPGESPQGV